MLLSDYLSIGNKLEEKGVFDPVLDKDSHFFINLQRLKKLQFQNLRLPTKKLTSIFVKSLNCLIEQRAKINRIFVINRR